ncbi:MAG: hypothetical protein IT319_17065 [Anaerolineae bacterium]|nr:hypothetical protein [Anaerolineae bacterium]
MMDEKTVFRYKLESDLQIWEAELEQWRRRYEHSDGSVVLRKEQQEMLEDLHEQRMRARQLLGELERSDDWTALKPEMEQLWANIRRSITAIRQIA